MRITPFAVEQWMNEFELRCTHNLAETCVASLTVDELLAIAGAGSDFLEQLRPMKLTYGAIEGSERLRSAIARLYVSKGISDVLVAHGAIGANALVYQALVGPGDRVVTVLPAYQQHYSIPESLGAEVARLALRADEGYLPNVDRLRDLVTDETRLIAFSNPNNPTGALMDRDLLLEIVKIADRVGAYILCDEVYRGTTQVGDALTPSIADLYERGIAVGSMSKAFSLAGLRLGWMCGPREVLHAAEVHRDYNTISVGMLDDVFAALALEHAEAILARSRHIVRTNLAVLTEWVGSESAIHWVRPTAGTTTLLQYDYAVPSRDFCVALLEQTGVLFTPGSAFDLEGCVRIGYANSPAVLAEGLERVRPYLRALESHR
jgi:aspartate/methionine/tyrosine aminotransferase